MIGQYQPSDYEQENLARDFYELASEAQLDFFPALYMRGLIDQIDGPGGELILGLHADAQPGGPAGGRGGN